MGLRGFGSVLMDLAEGVPVQMFRVYRIVAFGFLDLL